MNAEVAVKWFVKELNIWLRARGFKMRGRTFGRELDTCWQVINVQVSQYSSSDEKSLTINFGLHPKALMRSRQEDVTRAPLEYRCAIRSRIGRITQEKKDMWWTVRDAATAQQTLDEITNILGAEGIPFLDRLVTSDGLIQSFESSGAPGLEIDRDGTWIML